MKPISTGIWCGFVKYRMRRPKESFRYEITAADGTVAYGDMHYLTDLYRGGVLIVPDDWPPTSSFIGQSDTPGRKIFRPIDGPLRWQLTDIGIAPDEFADFKFLPFIRNTTPKYLIPARSASIYLSEGVALRLAADMKVDVTWFFESMLTGPDPYTEYKWFIQDSRVPDRYNVRKSPIPEEEMRRFWATRYAHLPQPD